MSLADNKTGSDSAAYKTWLTLSTDTEALTRSMGFIESYGGGGATIVEHATGAAVALIEHYKGRGVFVVRLDGRWATWQGLPADAPGVPTFPYSKGPHSKVTVDKHAEAVLNAAELLSCWKANKARGTKRGRRWHVLLTPETLEWGGEFAARTEEDAIRLARAQFRSGEPRPVMAVKSCVEVSN